MENSNKVIHKNMLLDMIHMFVNIYNDGGNEVFKQMYDSAFDYTMSMLKFAYGTEYGAYTAVGIAFMLEYGLAPNDKGEAVLMHGKISEEDPNLFDFIEIYEEVSKVFTTFNIQSVVIG